MSFLNQSFYYQEAINTHKWGRKTYKPDVHYAFKSTTSEDEWTEVEKTGDESKKYEDGIKALTAQLKEYINIEKQKF